MHTIYKIQKEFGENGCCAIFTVCIYFIFYILQCIIKSTRYKKISIKKDKKMRFFACAMFYTVPVHNKPVNQ